VNTVGTTRNHQGLQDQRKPPQTSANLHSKGSRPWASCFEYLFPLVAVGLTRHSPSKRQQRHYINESRTEVLELLKIMKKKITEAFECLIGRPEKTALMQDFPLLHLLHPAMIGCWILDPLQPFISHPFNAASAVTPTHLYGNTIIPL
jgi:hypothetical protein